MKSSASATKLGTFYATSSQSQLRVSSTYKTSIMRKQPEFNLGPSTTTNAKLTNIETPENAYNHNQDNRDLPIFITTCESGQDAATANLTRSKSAMQVKLIKAE
jgi:hypothetical protein